MIPSTWVSMMACLPDRVWRYSRSCGLFFERKCFPDRLGLGLVLPLYLDNDSFGVGMHTVKVCLDLVKKVGFLFLHIQHCVWVVDDIIPNVLKMTGQMS